MEFIKADGDKLRAGGKEILLRGFGLGGWFLTEGYMWQLYTKCDRPRRIEKMIETLCGKEYADSFWSRYLDVFITEDDIRWIAGRGFNCVRLPVNARRLCRMRAGKCEFVAETVSRIDRLIEWCKNNHAVRHRPAQRQTVRRRAAHQQASLRKRRKRPDASR